jgi:hypothetical protein
VIRLYDLQLYMERLPNSPGFASKPSRRLLKLKAAAEYLSLSAGTLRGFIQGGQIPIVTYGPNTPWLVDVRDLDTWVDRHKEIL